MCMFFFVLPSVSFFFFLLCLHFFTCGVWGVGMETEETEGGGDVCVR